MNCAVVGVFAEEENCWHPRAFVTLTEELTRDTDTVRDEILEFAKTNLSDEKQLRGGLYIVQKLPQNSNGKIQRHILRQADSLKNGFNQIGCNIISFL